MLDIKKFIKSIRILNAVDQTKALDLTVTNSATTATKTIVQASQTANRTLTLPDATDTLTANNAIQTLTNKSIDADLNSITNIENSDIKANAGIDASKIADGSISNTEFQYLNNLTSNIQSQLDTKITASSTDTLTNKSINADNNTITNIDNNEIKALAGIDATKIADGSVTSTEFQYINSLTSNAQTQIDSKINRSGDTMTGDLILNADPTLPLQAATKQYADMIAAGLDPKESVRVASVADLAATYATSPSNGRFTSAPSTIDGVSLSIGDRVLVKNQTDPKQNGIYTYDAVNQLTRSNDMDGSPASEVSAGNYTFVTQGTVNQGGGYVVLGNGVLTLNTDNINWTKFSDAGASTSTQTKEFKINSLYGGLSANNNLDGLWIAPTNCQIINVYIYNVTPGSSGTTELDIKIKPFNTGSFTSIFTTTPKITSVAGSNIWLGVGDSISGATAPIISGGSYFVAAKSALRMDLISSQLGNAANCGILLVYQEV